tara:strand:+ start:1499 stop:1804 length:306 start_codon:yes stop_codon:yes gene_type:complete
MAIESDFDRTILLADFGEAILYTPVNGSQVSIIGIFDKTYEAVDAGGSVSFAVDQPRVTARTSDVSAAAEGDAMIIRSQNYKVAIVMADGTGMTEFALEAQ